MQQYRKGDRFENHIRAQLARNGDARGKIISDNVYVNHIESIKTTSMETVTTEVLDKDKEYYLRSKDKAVKWYDVSIAFVKIQKQLRYTIHDVKPTS